MSADEKMTLEERRKYLRMMSKRYRQASRAEQSQLLDEIEAVTGLHRKSLVRLLGSDLSRQPRRQQRGRTYGVDVHLALKVISESCDYICAERLQPNLVWLASHLDEHGELEVTAEVLAKLATVSVPTVRRILTRLRQDEPRLPRRGPELANRAARQIPVQMIAWDEAQPGHFEVDLVHHCGLSADGLYIHTLQMVDVATGWSERVAILGRSRRVVEDGFRRILRRLPFPVLEVHSDNGSEFLNNHLYRFWQEAAGDPTLSRGRPYHKNDQRFVEQKNSSLVRAYLGQQRLDSAAQTNALNLLYDQMWLYYHFFQPVMRLAEKTVVREADQPTRLKRRFDQAQTPFDRLLAARILAAPQEDALRALRNQTNPRQLRQAIHQAIPALFALPGAAEDCPENIFQTLNRPLWPGIQMAAAWLPEPASLDAHVNEYFKVQQREEDSSVTLSFE
jgi:hypothetical protein